MEPLRSFARRAAVLFVAFGVLLGTTGCGGHHPAEVSKHPKALPGEAVSDCQERLSANRDPQADVYDPLYSDAVVRHACILDRSDLATADPVYTACDALSSHVADRIGPLFATTITAHVAATQTAKPLDQATDELRAMWARMPPKTPVRYCTWPVPCPNSEDEALVFAYLTGERVDWVSPDTCPAAEPYIDMTEKEAARAFVAAWARGDRPGMAAIARPDDLVERALNLGTPSGSIDRFEVITEEPLPNVQAFLHLTNGRQAVLVMDGPRAGVNSVSDCPGPGALTPIC